MYWGTVTYVSKYTLSGNRPIGVLGGTFDPVHHGHLRPALELLEDLDLAEVRFVPCRIPAHRGEPRAGAGQRARMLEAAIARQAGFVLDRRELGRDGPSYTVDTLASLRREFPEQALCLILGQDAFASLDTWHRWREIPRLAHLLVLERPGYSPDLPPTLAALLENRRLREARELRETLAGGILLHPVTQLAISATAIRERLAAGHSVRYLLPDTVQQFIDTQGLYDPNRQ